MMDSVYMQRCFDLALKGFADVGPNPMVGAVIVQNDQIIGEGYHQQYGQAHAEVNAIASVSDKTKLKTSTLYVNLEPCSHYGKTPPCVDLIIQMQIPKVVISCVDPNPSVHGQGVNKLRAAGVEVLEHVMEEEGQQLNKRFFTYIQKRRPYIILKWAQSQDGFMDIDRQEPSSPKGSYRITDEYLRVLDHLWRSQEKAILVGSQTLLIDNPQLNIRTICGRNPIRISIDRRVRLSENLHFFDKTQKSILFTAKDNASLEVPDEMLLYVPITPHCTLEEILKSLFQYQINSLIVEGGKQILESFIESNLWDEARVFVGNTRLEHGLSAPSLPRSYSLNPQSDSLYPAVFYPWKVNKQSILYFKNEEARYL
ncbi:MAG: bifunctional diaminohydroxyphosphoribosylaminopyrimidine deaminase/5-amino-6-(5-phosphoribosylamino)uracil reductase RibD [Bacteroidales bacterium]